MNISELIATKEAEHEKIMTVAKLLPESLKATAIDCDTIYCEHNTYDEHMKMLHCVRQKCGNYKLALYYMCELSLCLTYAFHDFRLNMYCDDAENALKIVSNEKCVIKTTTKTEKSLSVVCEINTDED